MPFFPPEVTDIILSFIWDKGVMCNVCLAGSAILSLAQRHLYRHLDMEDGVATIRMCLVLWAKPTLALLVRTLTLQWGLSSHGSRVFNIPGSTRLLFRTLRKMTCLKGFYASFKDDDTGGCVNVKNLPFRLTGLALAVPTLEVSFLEDQVSLEQLALGFVDYAEGLNRLNGLPQTAVPRLRSLFSDCTIAASLVPRRPVTSLGMKLFLDETETTVLRRALSNISLSTGPLLDLYVDVDTRDLRVDFFCCISSFLPSLISLTVSMKNDQVILDLSVNTSIVFPSFPALERMNLTSLLWQDLFETDWTPTVSGLGLASPSLTSIVFSMAEPSADLMSVSFKRSTVSSPSEGWQREQCLIPASVWSF